MWSRQMVALMSALPGKKVRIREWCSASFFRRRAEPSNVTLAAGSDAMSYPDIEKTTLSAVLPMAYATRPERATSPEAHGVWHLSPNYISELAGHSLRNALPSVSRASTLNVVAPLGT